MTIMLTITLPDKTNVQFDHPVTVLEVAEKISPHLARAAIAGKIDGKVVDLSQLIEKDASVQILTDKHSEGLDIIRHSTAHLLAQAVKQLFPNIQVTIGPVIENGFYYDFAFERTFTPEDLIKIEKRMTELVKQNISVKRIEMPRDKAMTFFKKQGEKYKAEIIKEIPSGEIISLYEQGDFTDLCRGPHISSTGKLKAFKLMKIAGAYWRGDSHNEMLQRIYGTAWGDKKALKDYLNRLEEAKKRDHRRIGKMMDLFHFQEEAPGMAFWHHNGWTLYKTILNYMRKKIEEYDYEEIYAPMMADKILWERSGHWEKFGQDGMFITESENREYVIKPMNCPGHIQIFNQGIKSYRNLPLRMGEFGLCHRNEASGTLHGLMRIREFIQDDAHIFCTPKQLLTEIDTLIKLVYEVYTDFGFGKILLRLATRPEKRIGEDAVWDKAEQALSNVLTNRGFEFELAPGEGAFYGPKIEFHLKDCLDRIWQCGTIQVDFSMPSRLNAHYIAEDGSKQTPIMIHRTILGSIERFIGMLLEQYAGWLPLWLVPTQAVILNITDNQTDYAHKLAKKLKKYGFRVKTDLRNEQIGFKIREHMIARVPYQLIVGDREVENKTVSVRHTNEKDSKTMTVDKLIQMLQNEMEEKTHR